MPNILADFRAVWYESPLRRLGVRPGRGCAGIVLERLRMNCRRSRVAVVRSYCTTRRFKRPHQYPWKQYLEIVCHHASRSPIISGPASHPSMADIDHGPSAGCVETIGCEGDSAQEPSRSPAWAVFLSEKCACQPLGSVAAVQDLPPTQLNAPVRRSCDWLLDFRDSPTHIGT